MQYMNIKYKKVYLIVNKKATGGHNTAKHAKKVLEALGVKIEKLYKVGNNNELKKRFEEVLKYKPDLVIIGGGDGSLSMAANYLANTGIPLAVLPLGTANDFARTLNIPCNLVDACQVIVEGKEDNIDLGLVTYAYNSKKYKDDEPKNTHYLNLASIGLGSSIPKEITHSSKRRFGALAYPFATLKAYLKYKPFHATFTFPQLDLPDIAIDNILQVGIGNGKYYGGGMQISPDASIKSESLEIYVISYTNFIGLFNIIRYLKSGNLNKSKNVKYFQSKEVIIETNKMLPINLDGDLTCFTPATFTSAPKALKVLVPQSFIKQR